MKHAVMMIALASLVLPATGQDVPLPRPRPADVIAAPEPKPEQDTDALADGGRVYQGACPAVINGLVEAEMAPPLSEDQCGERSPLVVTGVLVRGRMLPLSSPVTTNCAMATALPEWLGQVDGYSEAVLGSALASVTTGTSYQCRARVGGTATAVSEHGFANAVDVTGFVLEDGRSLTVEADWRSADGKLLQQAHDAACTGFTTVLGPDANAEHHDHLHLDLGCHGERCVARICE